MTVNAFPVVQEVQSLIQKYLDVAINLTKVRGTGANIQIYIYIIFA